MINASIIIPTKDKLSRLQLVLKALEPQVDETVEVLVVFDGCNQDTLNGFKDIPLKFEPVPIIHQKNLGRAQARNSGIRKAVGKILIFLDDDRIPAAEFVKKHVLRHENGRCAIIGERNDIGYSEDVLANLYQKGFTAAVFKQLQSDSTKEQSKAMKTIGRRVCGRFLDSVTFTTGNSSALRADVVKIGMFDEKFSGWGVEDIDLGYRLIKSGVKVIRDYSITNYHMVHPVDRSKQLEEYWQNLNYFLNKIQDDKMAVFLVKTLSAIIYRPN